MAHQQQQQAPRSGGGMYGINPQYLQQDQQQWYGGGGGAPHSAPGGYASGPSIYGGDESGNVHIGAQGVGGYPSYAAAPSHHHHQGGSTSWGGGGSAATFEGEEDYSNEPPLIEELGINFAHIWMKTKTIILPIKPLEDHVMDDADLAGPLFFLLAFGIFLLMTGKVHFGYIYGFGVSGCVAMYLVLNLLSAKEIDMWRVCSILGYGLLPVIVLAFLGILFSLNSTIGKLIAILVIGWSTYASSRLFEKALNLTHQRWLVAYPVGLLYSVFVLITIF